MAIGTSFVTLDDLYRASSDDSLALAHLKSVAAKLLPEGWKSWKVLPPVLPAPTPVDSSILNKSRFALPTLEIARAFKPDTSHISEGGWSDAKKKMLSWPFTRALLLAPRELALGIWGSEDEHNKLVQAAKAWKDTLISRREANVILGGSGQTSAGGSATAEAPMSGQATPSAFSTSSVSDARFEALEERFTRLERLLEQAVRPPVQVEDLDVEDSYSDCGSEGDVELVFEQVD